MKKCIVPLLLHRQNAVEIAQYMKNFSIVPFALHSTLLVLPAWYHLFFLPKIKRKKNTAVEDAKVKVNFRHF